MGWFDRLDFIRSAHNCCEIVYYIMLLNWYKGTSLFPFFIEIILDKPEAENNPQ